MNRRLTSGACSHWVGGHDDRRHEVAHVGGDGNLPDELPERQHGRPGHDAVDGNDAGLSGAVDDGVQLFDGRVTHPELHQETVKLGFRKRIGALHLNRILGGEHEKGHGQRS